MKRVYLLVSIIFLLWGCRNYEEGPEISLRNPKKVIAGNWQIASYTVDGADSMWVINGLHLGGEFRFGPYPEDHDPASLAVVTQEDTALYIYYGAWTHSKGGGEHWLDPAWFNFTRGRIAPYLAVDRTMMPFKANYWYITRLKNNQDLWLKAEVDGKKYELKFKAI